MPDFDTLKKWVRSDWDALRDWRSAARENFKFAAGDQWTDEEKSALEEQRRVPIVFNRTATILNAVVGSEINNRTEVRYLPRTLGDVETNETLTRGAEWFRDQCRAEEEETQAFSDSLISGLGWTETLMDFESDSIGEPKMMRINPLEMGWDASAERRGLSDSHRFFRVRQLGHEEAEELFEDVDEADLNADWLDVEEMDDEKATTQHADDDYNYESDGANITEKHSRPITIVQLQWRERRKDVEYIDPLSGKRGQMGARDFARVTKAMEGAGYDTSKIKKRDVKRFEWKQAFLGKKILDENQPCKDAPTFTPITCYWDNGNREWYGLLRQMKDPQKFANKWLSQSLNILNSNSKGGVMIEEDAVANMEDFENAWAAADAVQVFKKGALASGKIQPKPQAQFPQAYMGLTEFAITSIRDTSGVNQELLGLRDQNQPGVLEYQRKQAAMTTLAVPFDALRQYRLQQGKVLLYYMLEHMNDGRLIRIADEDGVRYERLQVDPDVVKYDVIVEDAPQSPNNKERVWEVIMQMMPILQSAGLPPQLWGEIIEYSPFPAALIAKMKEFAQKGQQPDPAAQQMQQLTVLKAQADIKEKEAEAQREQANAFENMMQGYKAQAEAQAAGVEASMIPMQAAASITQALTPKQPPVMPGAIEPEAG